MDIKVLFFGRLRELANVSESSMTLDTGTDLSVLLSKLGELYGEGFREELDGIQGLRILINGQEYQILGGMATCLEDNDTVAFLPPIEGG